MLPEPVQVPAAPVEAVEVEAVSAAAEVVATAAAEVAYEMLEKVLCLGRFRLTARVTVTKEVPPQTTAALEVATASVEELATTAAVSFDAEPELAEVPRVEAATLFPARSTAVKLEKPWATMT